MSNPLMAGIGPTHPGELLRAEIIPNSGMTKTAFAKRLGVSREALHNVLSGKSAVSTVLALKLSRLLGTTPDLWLNMQRDYDLVSIDPKKMAEIEKVEALDHI